MRDERLIANSLFWVPLTDVPWRDLRERFGSRRSTYHHFNRWRRTGSFDRILEALQIRLDRDGYSDWYLWCVDGTNVRTSRETGALLDWASGAKRKSRGTAVWAARDVVSGARYAWLLTGKALPSPSRSPRVRSRSQPASLRLSNGL